MSAYYFGFGSNMLRRRLIERVGECAVLGAGRLAGHRLVFHKRGRDGSGKCDVVPHAAAATAVYGVLFEMAPAQRVELDRFEGPGYSCETHAIEFAGRSYDAWVYVARRSHVQMGLQPYDWYKQFVLHGALENGVPDWYVRHVIEPVPALRDPDAARRAMNLALLPAAATSVDGDAGPASE